MNRVIAISYAAIVVSTLVAIPALFALSFRLADNNDDNNDDDNDDGGSGDENNREWRWDGPEAERAAKMVFGYSWMIVSTVALGVVAIPILKPTIASSDDAPISRLGAGVLGGATLLYANTALVCALYFWNMEAPDEEDEDEDQQQNRYLRDDDDEDGPGSYLLSVLCLVLFAIYLVLSAFILTKHNPSTTGGLLADEAADESDSSPPTDVDVARSGAHVEVLWDAWRSFSIIATAVLVAILIAGIVGLVLDERMREEGDIYNFVFILVWMIILSVCFFRAGKRVLGGGGGQDNGATATPAGEVETGAFGGAVLFFAGLTFLLAVLYGSFRVDGHGKDDGPIGSSAFCFLCLVLTAANLLFARGLSKYRQSLIALARSSNTSHESESSSGSFFVRMDPNKAMEERTLV